MRYSIPILFAALLCAACEKPYDSHVPSSNRQWFNTYQTDTSCQIVHRSHEDPFLKGPTGRAHPF